MESQRARSAAAASIIAGLLILFFVTSWTAWRGKSDTFDEPLHFTAAWVQTHYDDFRCDPEDPPLWRYYVVAGTNPSDLAVPMSGELWDAMLTNRLAEGAYFRRIFYATPENNPDAVLAAGRLRMLLLGVVLAAVIAGWAWRLAGPIAAVVAAAFFCLDPNFLAHSALVKNDVVATLAFLLFAIALWAVGNRASLWRVIALALSIILALLVKFSGVLAIPILLIALLIRARTKEPWKVLKWTLQTCGQRLLAAIVITVAACVVSYAAIWASYDFRYGPSADPAQIFDFRELIEISRSHDYFAAYNTFFADPEQQRTFNAQWHPGLVLRLGLWANAHRLLPQTWLEGFLFTYVTAPGRAAFLLGAYSMVGRWYYFPTVILVKTPLATLLALIVAAFFCTRTGNRPLRGWNAISFWIVPVIYLLVAVFSNLNLGIRHILPIYPFVFIFLGIAAAIAVERFRKPAIVAIILFILGLAIETFTAYPNFIPVFNITAGGWRGGPELLADSNVDWGQELPALAQWQRENPQYQVLLSYFGSADPRYYKIHYMKLPGGFGPEDEKSLDGRPVIYALSASSFHDPFISPQQRRLYETLRRQTPIAVLGHSIYLYNPPGE
jgi:4-amino-4-deoxy-L-arabinose transferase-like glycosyltransferase